MELAKPHVDFGLYTNDRDAMLSFWEREAGLDYDHLLPAGGGIHQHRFAMNGSVMKINHARDPLPDAAPSGYRELLIARDGLSARRELRDPEGNRVTLIPPGEEGVLGIAIKLAVRSDDAFHRFYGEVLGLEAAGSHAYRCGDSILAFARDTSAVATDAIRARGYRYITLQVKSVDSVHAAVVAKGATAARTPFTLGQTARISFVRDPDGNWIELSQRASLTGTLAPR